MLTKEDVFQGKCTEHQYYEDYLTPQIIDIVRRSTAYKHIVNSRDKEDFVDVSPTQWDFATGAVLCLIGTKPFKQRGDYVSQKALIGVVKAAARKIAKTRP